MQKRLREKKLLSRQSRLADLRSSRDREFCKKSRQEMLLEKLKMRRNWLNHFLKKKLLERKLRRLFRKLRKLRKINKNLMNAIRNLKKSWTLIIKKYLMQRKRSSKPKKPKKPQNLKPRTLKKNLNLQKLRQWKQSKMQNLKPKMSKNSEKKTSNFSEKHWKKNKKHMQNQLWNLKQHIKRS